MNTPIFLGILILILLVNVVFLVVLVRRKKEPEEKPADDTGFKLLLQQMNELSRTVDKKMGETNQTMNNVVRQQFSESQRLIQEVNKEVTKSLLNVAKEVTETREVSKQVMTIAEQLKNLEKVLKNQKQRGNLGELSLELILSNVLPPGTYKMQYGFKNNDRVDAVIITKEGLIPIDAKFSLENYARLLNEIDENRKADLIKDFKNDLKKRIDETSKYIRTDEGTLPLAFMFIPAEGIYYDLLVGEVGAVNSRNLIDYAYNDKKVIIVSPTTFYAYLQTVLHGLKAFKIGEQTEEIRKNVENLMKHLESYQDYHVKLGNTLSTAIGHYNASGKEFKKIDKDILRITGDTMEIEPLVLEKPVLEE